MERCKIQGVSNQPERPTTALFGKRKTPKPTTIDKDSSRNLKKAGDPTAPNRQLATETAAPSTKKRRKRAPPKVRLLNSKERREFASSIVREDVLQYVEDKVPQLLVGELFPDREVFWRYCFQTRQNH